VPPACDADARGRTRCALRIAPVAQTRPAVSSRAGLQARLMRRRQCCC
jgi:hypothetical protein